MTIARVERTALCTVDYCPNPTDPWWHACLRCESPEIHHHHVEPRGMGGSKSRKYNREGVVPLCPRHHDEITLNKWTDFISDVPQGRIYYVIDLHGEVKFEKIIGPPSSEGEVCAGVGTPARDASPSVPGGGPSDEGERENAASLIGPSNVQPRAEFGFSPSSPGCEPDVDPPGRGQEPHPSPPGISEQEDGDEADVQPRRVRGGAGEAATRREPVRSGVLRTAGDELSGQGNDVEVDRPDGGKAEGLGQDADTLLAPSIAEPYTFHENGIEFEQEYTLAHWRAAAKQTIAEGKYGRGQQWRVGDLVNGERWAECSQDFDDLGYPPETQANYGRVANAYKRAERRRISFAHHQAIYDHPDRLRLLDEAVENGWTRAQTRRAAYPDTAKPRVKRWTLADLATEAAGFSATDVRNNGPKYLAAFLEHLERMGEQT